MTEHHEEEDVVRDLEVDEHGRLIVPSDFLHDWFDYVSEEDIEEDEEDLDSEQPLEGLL